METQDQPQFDEWAIVELFGHQKMAGHVTQAPIGDMLRVDVHESEEEILYTRFINPKAIYAINPTTQEVAIAVAKKFATPPFSRWDLKKLLPEPAEVPVPRSRSVLYEEDQDEYDEEWEEDDDNLGF